MLGLFSLSLLVVSLLVYLFEAVMLMFTAEVSLYRRLRGRSAAIVYAIILFLLQIAKITPELEDTRLYIAVGFVLDYAAVCALYRGPAIDKPENTALRLIPYAAHKLLVTVLFYAFMLIGDQIARAIFTGIVFAPVEELSDFNVYAMLLSRLPLPVCIVIYSRLYRHARKAQIDHSFERRALVSILPLIIICVIFIAFSPWGDSQNLYYRAPDVFFAVFVVIVIALMLAVLSVQSSVLRERRLRERLALTRELERMRAERDAAVEAEQQRLNRILHDMNNHLAYLEIKSDSDYVQSLRERLGARLPETGNPGIDDIIFSKLEDMQGKGVRLAVRGKLPKEVSWLDPVDMVVILGNALDNAIKAVRALPIEDRAPIELCLACEDGSALEIIIRNKTPEAELIEAGSGTGLVNIAKRAAVYGGIVENWIEDGWFTLSVTLYDNTRED